MRYVLLSASVLALVACTPVSDPYAQIAAGQAALQATQVARSVAAEETRGAMDAAVLEATRYAGELLALQAQVEGTQVAIAAEQTAVSLQATRAAGDLAATAYRATAEVIRLQSTAAYLVQYGQAMSTATAIVKDREIMQAAKASQAAQSRSWRNIALVLAWGLTLAALAFLAITIHILWLRGKAQAELLRARAVMAAPPAALPQLPAPDHGRDEVMQFLTAAARIVGRDSARLPRYDAMGWSADRWSAVTDRLSAAGVLTKVTGGGGGSFIRLPYRDINGVYRALSTGALTLPPLPTGGVPQSNPPNVRPNTNTLSEGGW